MPQSLLPADWFSAESATVMRLATKNYADFSMVSGQHLVWTDVTIGQ